MTAHSLSDLLDTYRKVARTPREKGTYFERLATAYLSHDPLQVEHYQDVVPYAIRAIAKNYIENGWPISEMMNAKSQELSDCQYVRNHIAHNSLESRLYFNAVQRNLLKTERLFPITPGQLLRIRSKKFKKLHITHYFDAMNDTLNAIMDPSL